MMLPPKIAKWNMFVLATHDFHLRLCLQRHDASGETLGNGVGGVTLRAPRSDEHRRLAGERTQGAFVETKYVPRCAPTLALFFLKRSQAHAK